MQAYTDLESEFAHSIRPRTGTTDCTRGAVEAGEEAVTSNVELCAAEADELAADQRMVALEQLPPSSIAELCQRARHPAREPNGGMVAALRDALASLR